MKARRALLFSLALPAAIFVASGSVGSLAYFHYGNPDRTCSSCHEMSSTHAAWSVSAHQTLHCRDCHGGSLTLDVHALQSHVNRVVEHFSREPAAPIQLSEAAVLTLHNNCRECHPQSFADWQASRHSATYARIFQDPAHNSQEPPVSDCMRCHGMFFEGTAEDLVTKSDGRWEFKDPAQAALPTMPCLTCHRVHAPAAAAQPAHLHLYDQREGYFAASALPSPKVYRGEERIKVSSDPRQRLCVQCHAPAANHQLGTSDDRTLAGVHEGLSCLDCHQAHTTSAAASCRTCHPADSHCGLDVEKMDTTFLSKESRHNIHRVACGDCHEGKRPARH